jgi:hypothetical protein
MASPRATVSRRLQETKRREGRRQQERKSVASIAAAKTIALSENKNWDDRAIRAECADAALTLYQKDESLIRAFTEFGLDPRNPYDWKRLAEYMADALFGAKRGRPKEWTRGQELVFVHEVKLIAENEVDTKKSVLRAIHELKKRRNDQYGKLSEDDLKQKYYQIRKTILEKK